MALRVCWGVSRDWTPSEHPRIWGLAGTAQRCPYQPLPNTWALLALSSTPRVRMGVRWGEVEENSCSPSLKQAVQCHCHSWLEDMTLQVAGQLLWGSLCPPPMSPAPWSILIFGSKVPPLPCRHLPCIVMCHQISSGGSAFARRQKTQGWPPGNPYNLPPNMAASNAFKPIVDPLI